MTFVPLVICQGPPSPAMTYLSQAARHLNAGLGHLNHVSQAKPGASPTELCQGPCFMLTAPLTCNEAVSRSSQRVSSCAASRSARSHRASPDPSPGLDMLPPVDWGGFGPHSARARWHNTLSRPHIAKVQPSCLLRHDLDMLAPAPTREPTALAAPSHSSRAPKRSAPPRGPTALAASSHSSRAPIPPAPPRGAHGPCSRPGHSSRAPNPLHPPGGPWPLQPQATAQGHPHHILT